MSINDMIGDIDLSGRVAIVTGGGRGLGRVYAQWLAAFVISGIACLAAVVIGLTLKPLEAERA